MTVQRVSGLPANWHEIQLQHPADDEPMQLQLSDGVAHVHRGVAFERSFRRSVDRQSDAKFRLIGENGKKFAKIHLDLEQLRQEIDMRDNIIAKIVTFQDDLGLGNIKMEFKLGYFAIDTQTSESTPAPLTSSEPLIFDEVTVTTPVGPLGASFANTLIPPTIIRLVPLPDGSESPLAGKVHPRSELIKFNGLDATLWTLDDFKDHLIASKGDAERVLVFSVPRLTEEMETTNAEPEQSAATAAAQDDAPETESAEEPKPVEAVPAAADGTTEAVEATEAQQGGATEADDEAEVSTMLDGTSAAVAAGAVVAGGAAVAVATTAGDDDSPTEDNAAKEPEATDNTKENTPEADKVEEEPTENAPAEEADTQPKDNATWDKGYLTEMGYDKKEDNLAAAGSGPEFTVSIPHYVIDASHQFVMYEIVCEGISSESRKYRVLRRYNNFVELKAQLETELDGAALPDLPSKWTWNAIFKRFDEGLVEDRRLELEGWLQRVYALASEALSDISTFKDFLTAVPEHNEVLNFHTAEKVEVVLKEGGDVRLYGEGFDTPTPRHQAVTTSHHTPALA